MLDLLIITSFRISIFFLSQAKILSSRKSDLLASSRLTLLLARQGALLNLKLFFEALADLLYLQSRKKGVLSYKSREAKMVRCLRGRKDQFAKLTYGKLYRGFESLPHRKPGQCPCQTAGHFCLVAFATTANRYAGSRLLLSFLLILM